MFLREETWLLRILFLKDKFVVFSFLEKFDGQNFGSRIYKIILLLATFISRWENVERR